MRYRRIDKKSFHFDIYSNYEAMTSSLLDRQTKVWSGSAAVFGTGLKACHPELSATAEQISRYGFMNFLELLQRFQFWIV